MYYIYIIHIHILYILAMVRESVPFQRDMLTDPMDSHHFPQKGMAMDVATPLFFRQSHISVVIQ